MRFKKGDYVYYFDGKDTYPCVVLEVKKRVKITTGEGSFAWTSWVSPYSLEMQPTSIW